VEVAVPRFSQNSKAQTGFIAWVKMPKIDFCNSYIFSRKIPAIFPAGAILAETKSLPAALL
jgi:hypothetical protein